jgi:hypothetical protein
VHCGGVLLSSQFFQVPQPASMEKLIQMNKVGKLILEHPYRITQPTTPAGKPVGNAPKDRKRLIFLERSWQNFLKHTFPFIVLVERKYFNGARCEARRNVKSFVRFLRHIDGFSASLHINDHST